MSKIALSGPASGTATYTISAPTGATDRTITLPDQTGTLLTGSGAIGVNSSAATNSLVINASGNLGLGVTPSAWGSTRKAFQLNSGSVYATTAGDTIGAAQNAYNDGTSWKYVSNGYATSYYQNSGGHYFNIAASGTAGNTISFTQAMTLDASGNLLVGTTTNGFSSTNYGIQWNPNGESFYVANTAPNLIAFNRNDNNGIFKFFRSGTQVGAVSVTTTTTTYATSSDYRLKEDVAPMTGALSVVSQLKPCTYKWKADGSDGQGFIAHELQAVVPECVTGEKDAVDANGNPVYQGIDTSFLVATLTAAIQELKAINDAQAETITALTARVTALEGTQP